MKEEKSLKELAEEIYQARSKKIREKEPDISEYIRCILEIFSASIEDDELFCLSIKCAGGNLKVELTTMPDFECLEVEDISSSRTKEAVEKLNNMKGNINILSRLSEGLNKLPHFDGDLVGENSSKLLIRLTE